MTNSNDDTNKLIEALANDEHISKSMIPQCSNWHELRHLLENSGLTTIGGVYIYSIELDTKRLNDALFGNGK